MSEMEIADALSCICHKIIPFKKHALYSIAGFEYPHADIVLNGEMTARMVSGSSGRQLEVIQFRKGDVIAPNFIFANPNVMPVTIETESEVNILRMSSRSLQQLVDSFSTIRWNFIGILSNIGAYLASKMKFISLLTIKEKVRFYLHTEALVQHSKTIVLAQSRQHLADSFAIQKSHLSDAWQNWQKMEPSASMARRLPFWTSESYKYKYFTDFYINILQTSILSKLLYSE